MHKQPPTIYRPACGCRPGYCAANLWAACPYRHAEEESPRNTGGQTRAAITAERREGGVRVDPARFDTGSGAHDGLLFHWQTARYAATQSHVLPCCGSTIGRAVHTPDSREGAAGVSGGGTTHKGSGSSLRLLAQHAPRNVGAQFFAANAGQSLNVGAVFGWDATARFPIAQHLRRDTQLVGKLSRATSDLHRAFNGRFLLHAGHDKPSV